MASITYHPIMGGNIKSKKISHHPIMGGNIKSKKFSQASTSIALGYNKSRSLIRIGILNPSYDEVGGYTQTPGPDVEALKAAVDTKRKLTRSSAGRGATMLTGGQGVTGGAPRLATKMLLG